MGYIKFTSGSNSVEFPAVGYRNGSDGTVINAGQGGYYWSSVAGSSYSAYNLVFNSGSLGMSNNNKQHGFSVRCVR